MRAGALQYSAALLITVALVGTAATAAERKDGRPQGSKPGQTKGVRKATYPRDRGSEDVDGKSRGGAAAIEPADQVIGDDLIVTGSLCVGFDCVNGEAFGFDTIRLKENNLRIRFEDTSTGSFPSNDWEITINDSASGGADRFSIMDVTGSTVPVTVQAGATTDTLVVASNSNVGLGTSAPVLDLHLSTNNTPGIRLAQTAAGGFTAQTWDMAGNEANFFVRDVTGGSRLPFRIRPGAPTSSVDIAASGNVGLGTSSPQAALHVAGSDPRTIRIERTGATDPNAWDVGDSGNGTFMIDSVGSARVEVTVTGGGMFRVAPVKHPPQGARKGAMYNDSSGALCWYSGKKWLKVVGPGSCS